MALQSVPLTHSVMYTATILGWSKEYYDQIVIVPKECLKGWKIFNEPFVFEKSFEIDHSLFKMR